MTLFKIVGLPLMVLSLISCVKADRNASNPESESLREFSRETSLIDFNNRALFEAGQVTLEDVKFSFNGISDFQQVNQIQLFLKMCGLKDRASQGTIRNEKFHVQSELGQNIYLTSDRNRSGEVSNPITVNSENCLRWNQYVPVFDYLAPSVNIVLHYEIKSLAGGLGRMVRRIGFNPWDMYRNNSKTRGFLDLTDFNRSQWPTGEWIVNEEQVIAALKGELLPSNATLQIKNFTVEPVEREQQRVADYNRILETLPEEERRVRQEIDRLLLKESGLQINMNLSAFPFVRVYDSTNVPHDVDLTTGQFRVYMNLIASGATDSSEKHLLSSNVSEVTGRTTAFNWNVNAQGLLASVPMVLRNRTEFGRVELLVKIEPVSPGINKIKPFTAVFDLGNYDTWVRRQGGFFKYDEGFQALDQVSYDRYIHGLTGVTSDMTTIRQADRFYFGPLRMRFVRIMPGESATDRTLQYSIYSCIEHGLYGNRVGRGLQFDIETEDKYRGKYKIRRQTNEEGCITWFGFLSHKYYRKEVLEKKVAKVQFVGTNSRTSQFSSMINRYEREFTYYMNPWDEKFTFGWDEPDMPENYPAEVEKQRKTAPVSQLFMADFRYETMGFRYEIDKYLNLKVKKSVLFKAYPYVLKYNSIVYGRKGTEPLRDGIYLMKVALQKDYLDPAAKGVRIYDKEIGEVDMAAREVEETPQDAYSKYDQEFGQIPQLETGEPSSHPGMVDGADQDVNHRLLSDSELNESKKEYISVQTMLVRILGGMIITPVEFEVDDLRLMRIRNQFFIQLQTIDEHKLRVATMLDQTFNQMFQNGNIEARYEEIFKTLDHIEDIEDSIIQTQLDALEDQAIYRQVELEVQKKRQQIEDLRAQLDDLFGLNEFKKDSSEYLARKTIIQDRLQRLQEYRSMVNGSDGLSFIDSFRNDKRLTINRIMSELQNENNNMIELSRESLPSDLKSAESEDPFLQFFYASQSSSGLTSLGGVLDYKIAQARQAGNTSYAADLESILVTDFTLSPLTPSFDFDMLRNDGAHNSDLPEDDGKSGLPARTFVGPLTFVFNTNGSSIRPTDILNEQFCTTAFCDQPRILREKIDKGIPPIPTESTLDLDSNGQFTFSGQPIYDHGNSVNANYENNKYYGYLKEYFGVTVDDLIEKKKKINEDYKRKMEAASQIVNFTKTMGLKYVLLNDNPGSRLKSVDFECVKSAPIGQLNRCFEDLRSTNDVLPVDDFMAQLNERKPLQSNFDTTAIGKLNNRGEAYYYLTGNAELSNEDLKSIMTHGWLSNDIEPLKVRKFMHRMCFVLAQNFFTQAYFDKPLAAGERFSKAVSLAGMNRRSVLMLEEECQKYVGNVYQYDIDQRNLYNLDIDRNRRPRTLYSPIVIERKVRAYETTHRYVYRGGKSLNINLSTNFTLSSSHGVKLSTTSNFKPWDWARDTFKDVVQSVPIVGPIVNNVVGAFSVTRSSSRDESAGRTQGLTVSAGTFLVNQQATFDIELGEYERCMVVRFHPAFLKGFFTNSNVLGVNSYLKRSFDDNTDIASQGLLICTGEREKKCLPVKERYYYFTQHFTEGDMLDTADLHNHPWLLQMRGLRDFQTFTAQIGAREVGYIDDNSWLKQSFTQVSSDAAAIATLDSSGINGSHVENMTPKFQIVNQESDINWPLEELSRTYFEVLPTFPGFYTFMTNNGQERIDWPYRNTDPGQSFTKCEE